VRSGLESAKYSSREPQLQTTAIEASVPSAATKLPLEKHEPAQILVHTSQSTHERAGGASIAPTVLASGDGAATLVRDLSNGQREGKSFHAQGVESTGTVGGPNVHETFTALDSDAGPRTSWIHADARSAEAGFPDQTLGWVGVRANTGSGGVHASVLPGSVEAAQALGGHMEGLNAFLSHAPGSATTVTLDAPKGAEGNGNYDGGQQSMGSGHGQGANSGSSQDSGAAANQPSLQMGTSRTHAASEVRTGSEQFERTDASSDFSGGHISIMA